MPSSDPMSALLVGLIVGCLLGIAGAWITVKRRVAREIDQARRVHEMERDGFHLRNATLASETADQAQRLRQGENEIKDVRATLQRAQIDLAQVTERAARLPEVERIAATREHDLVSLRAQQAQLDAESARLTATLAARTDEVNAANLQTAAMANTIEALQSERAAQAGEVARLTTSLSAEREQNIEKISLLLAAKDQLADQFKALATEILEEKSKRFAEQNQATLGQMLEPLKVKLAEFQGKVEEVYVQEGKDRVALGEQVRQLAALNQQLSQDAHQLTRALKGDAKARGNWGEVILERMLEAAGLRKGEEYTTQSGQRDEDGTRSILDVIVNLPEDRYLIIDSKVSLVAFEEYANAEADAERDAALKRHVDSVRNHLKGLSIKNYESIFKKGSPDFVVMFVPIEPAFLAAIGQDTNLWQTAWNKSVLIVSPSSLLFVLRSVAYLWRQEQQSRNYQEIADRGASLYDKLVGFVAELTKVGDKLREARETYDDAVRTLSVERGNVIRQAEQLKRLGVKPKKALPQALIRQNDEVSDEDAAAAPLDPTPTLASIAGLDFTTHDIDDEPESTQS